MNMAKMRIFGVMSELRLNVVLICIRGTYKQIDTQTVQVLCYLRFSRQLSVMFRSSGTWHHAVCKVLEFAASISIFTLKLKAVRYLIYWYLCTRLHGVTIQIPICAAVGL